MQTDMLCNVIEQKPPRHETQAEIDALNQTIQRHAQKNKEMEERSQKLQRQYGILYIYMCVCVCLYLCLCVFFYFFSIFMYMYVCIYIYE